MTTAPKPAPVPADRALGAGPSTLATLAVALLGLNAGLALAHVLEAPNKWRLSPEVWLAVQQDLYDGWGTWIPALELVAVLALAVLAWRAAGRTRWLLLGAIASLLIAEAVIWPIWVLSTNQTVDAWTVAEPMPGWEALRLSWEGGHAARFVVLLAGLLCAAWVLVSPAARRRAAVS